MPTLTDAAKLRLAYEENGRVTAVFWEWRHKVILLAATTLGAVTAIAAWLYDRDLRWVLSVPFAIGAVILFSCSHFERRIAGILEQCYHRGLWLEAGLLAHDQWFFGVYTPFAIRPQGVMRAKKPPRKSFSLILRWGYPSLAVILVGVATAVLVIQKFEPRWLEPRR
jgi:hypothetical protein